MKQSKADLSTITAFLLALLAFYNLGEKKSILKDITLGHASRTPRQFPPLVNPDPESKAAADRDSLKRGLEKS